MGCNHFGAFETVAVAKQCDLRDTLLGNHFAPVGRLRCRYCRIAEMESPDTQASKAGADALQRRLPQPQQNIEMPAGDSSPYLRRQANTRVI